METNHLYEKKLSVFFCDPSSPWQNPHVEKNTSLFGIQKIPANEVIQSPALLKK